MVTPPPSFKRIRASGGGGFSTIGAVCDNFSISRYFSIACKFFDCEKNPSITGIFRFHANFSIIGHLCSITCKFFDCRPAI